MLWEMISLPNPCKNVLPGPAGCLSLQVFLILKGWRMEAVKNNEFELLRASSPTNPELKARKLGSKSISTFVCILKRFFFFTDLRHQYNSYLLQITSRIH